MKWVNDNNQFSYHLSEDVKTTPASCPDKTLSKAAKAAFEALCAGHKGTTAAGGAPGTGAAACTDTLPQGPPAPGEPPVADSGAAAAGERKGTKRKQADTPLSAATPRAVMGKSPRGETPSRTAAAKRTTRQAPGDAAGPAAGGGAARSAPALVGQAEHQVLVGLYRQLKALSCTAESSTAADIQALITGIDTARLTMRGPDVHLAAETLLLSGDVFGTVLLLVRLHELVQSRGGRLPPSEEEKMQWRLLTQKFAAEVPSGPELEGNTQDMMRIARTHPLTAPPPPPQLPPAAHTRDLQPAAQPAPAASQPPGKPPSVLRPTPKYPALPAGRSPVRGTALAPSALPAPLQPPAAPFSPALALGEKEVALLVEAMLEVLSANPDGCRRSTLHEPVCGNLCLSQTKAIQQYTDEQGQNLERALKQKVDALLSLAEVQPLVVVDDVKDSMRLSAAGKTRAQKQQRSREAAPQHGAPTQGAHKPQPGRGGGTSAAGPSAQAAELRARKGVPSAAAAAGAPGGQEPELTEAAILVLRGQGKLTWTEFATRIKAVRPVATGKLGNYVGQTRDCFLSRSPAGRWYLFGIDVDKGRIWLHEPAVANNRPERYLYKQLHAAGPTGMTVSEALKCLREAYPHLVEMAASKATWTSLRSIPTFNLRYLQDFQSCATDKVVCWVDAGARLAMTLQALAEPDPNDALALRPARQPRATAGAVTRKVQGPKLGRERVTVTSADVAAMSAETKKQYDLWCSHQDAVRMEADAAAAAAMDAAAAEAQNGARASRSHRQPAAACRLCEQPAGGSAPCATCHTVFCAPCLRDCFMTPNLSVEALREQCPECRNICFCAACSGHSQWRNTGRFGDASLVTRQEHAQYLLAVTKAQLVEVQRQQREAVQAAGGVPPKRMAPRADEDGRMNCDGCNTSIADMCWCCDEASGCQQVDLCLTCASTLRDGTLPLLLRTRFKGLASVPPVQLGQQLLCPCYHARGEVASGSKRPRAPEEEVPPLLTLQTIMDAPALVEGVLTGLPGAVGSLSGDLQGGRTHDFQPAGNQHTPGACPWCCWLASLTQPDETGVRDLRTNPNLRRAAWRGTADDWLWTPHADDVDASKLTAAQYSDVLAHFQWHFRRRQFPVVRGLTPKLAWTPGQLQHLLAQQEAQDGRVTQVLWCRDGATGPCSAEDFGAAFGDLMSVPFARGEDRERGKLFAQLGDMLKLKDWPADRSFGDAVPRHCADFIAMLPFQEYTNMADGPLNLATRLPQACFPPDLGPKSYVAHGVQQERGGPAGGDSVTRLHEDMSDAVNVLLYSTVCDTQLVAHLPEHKQVPLQAPDRRADDVYETSSLGPQAMEAALQAAQAQQAASGGLLRCVPAPANSAARRAPKELSQAVLQPSTSGALWHIFRREDTLALGSWLLSRLEAWKTAPDEGRKREVLSCGVVCTAAEVDHPIHSQAFYLGSADLAALKRETGGLEPWGFYQYDNECVFIPAGCPHQVRNTRSCIKVALDFVSPEAVRECNVLSKEYAGIGMEDKLQGRAMLIHGAKAALGELQATAGGA